MSISSAHVIINPAAGQNDAILNQINDVFKPADIAWGVSVTHQTGDARRLAGAALEAGVDAVVVYGGDGTVREVAGVLAGSDVPMAILPGGTANLFAVEMGLPRGILRAARLLTGEVAIKRVDVGMAGDQPFIIGAGTGVIARVMRDADRQLKRQIGSLAYYVIGVQKLLEPEHARYRLTLDGDEVIEQEAVACLVSNTGSVGISGVSVPWGAQVSDGLVHVVLFRNVDIPTLRATAADAVGLRNLARDLPRWSAQRVMLEADPPQSVTCDGDIVAETTVEITVRHESLKVIVPPGGVQDDSDWPSLR